MSKANNIASLPVSNSNIDVTGYAKVSLVELADSSVVGATSGATNTQEAFTNGFAFGVIPTSTGMVYSNVTYETSGAEL